MGGSPALHTCAQFLLRQGEFTRLSNGSIFVSNYNLLLSPGQHRPASPASPGSLYICTPEAIASRGQAKFSPIMGYVTFACLGVSLVCLLLHLVISLIAPELQNLSGKNLSSSLSRSSAPTAPSWPTCSPGTSTPWPASCWRSPCTTSTSPPSSGCSTSRLT